VPTVSELLNRLHPAQLLARTPDPGRAALRRASRIAIVLPIAYWLVEDGLHRPSGALEAAFAVFALLLFADFGGPMLHRFVAYLLTALAGLVMLVIGSLAANSGWVSVLVGAFGAFALTYAGVLRGYVAAAGLALLMPLVIALTATPAVSDIPNELVGWAIGSVLAIAAAMLLWPRYVQSNLRLRTAEALSAAAALIRALWPESMEVEGDDASAALKSFEATTADLDAAYDGHLLRPGAATSRDRSLMLVVDGVERLRTFLAWVAETTRRRASSIDRSLLAACQQTLELCARAMQSGPGPPMPSALNSARERHTASTEYSAGEALGRGDSDSVAMALHESFRVRIIALQTQLIATDVRGAVGAPPDQDPVATYGGAPLRSHRRGLVDVLRAQLHVDSPWLRNSVRTGIAVGLGVLAADLVNLEHGFWVVLGTVSVLRLDARATQRVVARAFAGTVIGFALGIGAVALIEGTVAATWTLLPILAFLAAWAPAARSVVASQASFTLFVITLYELYDPTHFHTAEYRLLTVGVGLAVSLLMSALLWPRGVTAAIGTTVTAALRAASDYLVTAYDRITNGPVDDELVDRRARAARAAIQRSDETFDLAISSLASRQPTHLPTVAWAELASGANQLESTASLVTLLARMHQPHNRCPVAEAAIAVSAHRVRVRIAESAHLLDELDDLPGAAEVSVSPRPAKYPSGLNMDDRLNDVQEAISACLYGWSGSSDEWLGRDAMVLVLEADYLQPASWLADRVAAIAGGARDLRRGSGLGRGTSAFVSSGDQRMR
jgi:uncharacterized membrane protein YccC